MSNKINVVFLLLLFIFSISTIANSGTTGKIAGFVKDSQTGDILVGANVVIEGTTMGAATDMTGYYFIINIPPGKYRVKALMMGYQAVVKTEVQVVVDLTTKLDFELSATVLAGEVVEVVAERPLIEKDVTSSSIVTTGEQIDKMPVNTYQEVLVLSPGFVESGSTFERDINVRGGRTGELSYMIDGFYVEDPIMGGMGSDVTNVGIAELAVLTGTFNAEYGEAMSGILNIVTKEGGNTYNGRIRFLTDRFVNPHEYKYLYKYLDENGQWIHKDPEAEDGWSLVEENTADRIPGQNKYDPDYWEWKTKKVSDFRDYRTDLYFGGPLPLLGKGNSFFISGDVYDTKTYLGWFSNIPYVKDRRANAKVVLRPTKSIKLTLGAVGQKERSKGSFFFVEELQWWKYIPEVVPTDFNNNYMFNGTWTHQLSPNTFYTIRSSVFNSNRHFYTYEAKDFFSEKVNGEWQILNEDGEYTGKAKQYWSDEEYEFYRRWFDDEDSVWTAGGGNDWIERKSVIMNGKFDLTSQLTNVHQVKLGFEIKQLDLKFHYVSAPYEAAPTVWKYHHKPVEGSAYFQDKMEFDKWGMVINAGLRLDYMNTKAKYVWDPHNPTQEKVEDPLTGELRDNIVDADKKLHISPRLGFAHPITDKAVLHFAYGHFYQIPEYYLLFRMENEDDASYPAPNMSVSGIYSMLGNANLKPEKTIAYELGMETKLTTDISLDVTFYFRNIYDYVAFRRYPAIPVQYHRFTNLDYANTKGVEITLKKRFTKLFGGQLYYGLCRAEGNAADEYAHYNDWYFLSVYKTYPPKKMVTMDWDQTHIINFVLDFGKPGNWGLNLVGSYGSGLPYTPTSARGARLDELNSARMPWTMYVNVRATKSFKWKGMNFTLYADMDNIFNKENVLSVYSNSGKPDATIDWDDTQDYMDRPDNFGSPRTLIIGLSAGF